MYSDELLFLEFLNYLIQLDDNKYYNTISVVSSESRGDPSKGLINSNKKMLNFEEVVLDYYGEDISPSIVDGLYFNFNKHNKLSLFFIEFKGDKLDKKTWKNYFKEYIESLPDNVCSDQHENCPVRKLHPVSLRKIYEQYADEILVQLKMKPLESLLIAMPSLFKRFSGLDSKDNYVLNNYFDCHIYVVHVKGDKNPANSHGTSQYDIKNKYGLFVNSGLIYKYQVLTESGFKKDMISKIEKFPIHFLNNILVIVNDLKNECGKSNFKKLVIERLDEELVKESLDIPRKHRNRLVEVICKYCNF